jgi:uncharacterized DUF497 family protein
MGPLVDMVGDDESIEVDGLRFVWAIRKAAINRLKHGVTFEEAATVFGDAFAVIRNDPDGSASERRMWIMGYSSFGRLLLVVHVEVHDETIRIISARKLGSRERRRFERE